MKNNYEQEGDLMPIYPTDGYIFDTHTDVQREFIQRIKDFSTENALSWLSKVKNDRELSHPATLRFEWERSYEKTIFELSENEDFSQAIRLECDENFCEIGNFKVGKKYFWRINGGKTRFFFTSNEKFRFIKLDGALNVRDIGGVNIKQGLVFRGSDIDLCFPLTEDGKKAFRQLNIKTELELRSDVDQRDCIAGKEVSLVRLPYRPYIEVFSDMHRAGLCRIMEFLSDEANYPIYIHCMGGADRTGMIALYLRALCGEDDDTIHTDYELTGLSTYALGASEGADGFRSRNSDYYREFFDKISEYAPTGTLSQKVRGFVLSCGVKSETIDRIINILCKGE